MTDIFAIQDEIATAIALSMRAESGENLNTLFHALGAGANILLIRTQCSRSQEQTRADRADAEPIDKNRGHCFLCVHPTAG